METKQIISWLRDKAARADNLSWTRMMHMAADRLWILENRRKWIPVTERLPKANKLVLCWWQSGDGEREHYGFATYQHHGVWYVSNEGMPEVTHWMPLPEPPKGE